jgi:hypothetical protein
VFSSLSAAACSFTCSLSVKTDSFQASAHKNGPKQVLGPKLGLICPYAIQIIRGSRHFRQDTQFIVDQMEQMLHFIWSVTVSVRRVLNMKHIDRITAATAHRNVQTGRRNRAKEQRPAR